MTDVVIYTLSACALSYERAVSNGIHLQADTLMWCMVPYLYCYPTLFI